MNHSFGGAFETKLSKQRPTISPHPWPKVRNWFFLSWIAKFTNHQTFLILASTFNCKILLSKTNPRMHFLRRKSKQKQSATDVSTCLETRALSQWPCAGDRGASFQWCNKLVDWGENCLYDGGLPQWWRQGQQRHVHDSTKPLYSQNKWCDCLSCQLLSDDVTTPSSNGENTKVKTRKCAIDGWIQKCLWLLSSHSRTFFIKISSWYLAPVHVFSVGGTWQSTNTFGDVDVLMKRWKRKRAKYNNHHGSSNTKWSHNRHGDQTVTPPNVWKPPHFQFSSVHLRYFAIINQTSFLDRLGERQFQQQNHRLVWIQPMEQTRKQDRWTAGVTTYWLLPILVVARMMTDRKHHVMPFPISITRGSHRRKENRTCACIN